MSLKKDKLEQTKLIVEIFYVVVLALCAAGAFYFTYIRKPADTTPPPAVAMPVEKTAPSSVPQQDIKTGSIPKKTVAKPKPAAEPPATLVDWIKRQFEPDPLRDKYTRD